ncbi:hypothetical protein ACLKA6_004760 [Drosophila palustris]
MAQLRTSVGCGTHSAVLVLLFFLCSSQAASLAGGNNELAATGLSDQVVDQLGDNDLYNINNNNKRAWQSLQSSWGKRSADPSALEVSDSIYMTGHFVPMVITDGTNTMDWTTFERLASGNNNPEQPHQSNEEIDDDFNGDNSVEKRAWKNMNVAWGKRRQAQGWNKFRGAWGKRDASWNNLKGMWGKRDQWQKLHAGWGKRSSSSIAN